MGILSPTVYATLLPEYQDTKTAIRSVLTEDGRLHIAWKLDAGKVLVFEHIPDNFPKSSLVVIETKEEYEMAANNVDWIREG